ncbi:MAG: TatD family hydrolase [Clostridia bacterium]|nr:TatD family hydrolase [Clostridia bacterium]
MELFDTHSHYNDEKFDIDREETIQKTYKQGITKFVCAGYNLKSSREAIDLANKYDFIYSICGISPNDLEDYNEENILEIKKLAKNKKNVAIGEIGLDYYWNRENKDLQKQAFIEQINLANELELPIVIHSRDAVQDTIDLLKENPVNKKGIFHCAQLNKYLVEEGLKLGFYISFAGPITFKNSKNAKEIVNLVPNDKILIETDSPYLAPEPVRGIRNDSTNVRYVAQKIAELKGISVEEIAKITYQNAMRIFEI